MNTTTPPVTFVRGQRVWFVDADYDVRQGRALTRNSSAQYQTLALGDEPVQQAERIIVPSTHVFVERAEAKRFAHARILVEITRHERILQRLRRAFYAVNP